MQPDYAKSFRIIRAAFGLQQAELSRRMDIDSSHLSLIESGKRQPSTNVINKLAISLGIPAALITLLASSPEDVASQPDSDVAAFGKTLLRLLVSATELKQGALPFAD